MAINKINYKFFNKKINNEEDSKILYSNIFDEKISFIKENKFHSFEYSGIKIIKTSNTNKAIKDLIYKDRYETYIKINDNYLKQSDVVIISSFTKVSDILSSRTNGNIHSYLKNKNCIKNNNMIEEFISRQLNEISSDINDVIEYDLSKCDLINYIDVKDDFVDENNISNILDILKTYDKKILIIFNDVDYLKYELVAKYFQHYNFLYFVNNNENNYESIDDIELYLIEYDYLNNEQNAELM